ncbi:putative 5'(3')-deoxyribonucleotidase [Paraliobacillus quinghaiensis]|uniref:5'(3')-deoxyribonucleotidase n=1 Tax=Paraliobacillus quinghaiensis TaxID=470815 RepID=A0A917TV50_9BACI|nr:5'-3'-deoxyribonucleotidase [Paraliobacillus quinghaiensis]GGM39292.1 putative 5'(3')-deoxyribonucleotidase [Paraliobacillus quinghaiensis]
MERIAIDMDDVIADPLSKHLALFNKRYNENISIKDLEGKYLTEVRPELHQEILDILAEPTFFRDLDIITDSQEVIKELSQHYEVFIATAAMELPSSFTSKYEWLKEHFSFLNERNFIFCGDKSIIKADYLIDDSPRNFMGFEGQGILFTNPYNLHVTDYVRVNNWQEVREFFLK